MKKRLSLLPFLIACCLLLGVIGWTAVVVYGAYRETVRLEQLPSADSVDYLGIYLSGIFFSIGVFVLSFCGIIASGIGIRVSEGKKLRTASVVLTVLFGLLLILAVAVWLLW